MSRNNELVNFKIIFLLHGTSCALFCIGEHLKKSTFKNDPVFYSNLLKMTLYSIQIDTSF